MLSTLRQHSRLVTYGILTAILLIQVARSVSICDFTQCPPAPWSTQLATAQKAAHRRGRDFALVGVLATGRYTGNEQGDDLSTLEVGFDFVNPNVVEANNMALALTVSIDDTNPRTSISVLDDYYTNERPTPAFQRAVSLVQISPADALKNALPHVPQRDRRPDRVLIGLHPRYPDDELVTPTTLATWSVLFLTAPFTSTTVSTTVVDVDARTGEVVKVQ
jgi:hypothetical protein